MKILFFHGYESSLPSSKADWMQELGHEVLAHPMEYQDPQALKIALEKAREFAPDMIVGSSMGGFFASQVGTHIPTQLVLLNPLLDEGRVSFELLPKGQYRPKLWALLGEKDDVIEPYASEKVLMAMDAQVAFSGHGHRTPLNIFSEFMNKVFLECNPSI